MENTRGWTVNKWMKNSPKKNRKPKLKKETLTHLQKTKQEHKRERGQLTLRTGQCHPKWLRQTDIWRHNSRIMKHRRDTHTHSTVQYNTTVTASRFLFSNSKPTSIRPFQWLDKKVLLDVQLDFFKAFNIFLYKAYRRNDSVYIITQQYKITGVMQSIFIISLRNYRLTSGLFFSF